MPGHIWTFRQFKKKGFRPCAGFSFFLFVESSDDSGDIFFAKSQMILLAPWGAAISECPKINVRYIKSNGLLYNNKSTIRSFWKLTFLRFLLYPSDQSTQSESFSSSSCTIITHLLLSFFWLDMFFTIPKNKKLFMWKFKWVPCSWGGVSTWDCIACNCEPRYELPQSHLRVYLCMSYLPHGFTTVKARRRCIPSYIWSSFCLYWVSRTVHYLKFLVFVYRN